jgi:hypothetical protein
MIRICTFLAALLASSAAFAQADTRINVWNPQCTGVGCQWATAPFDASTTNSSATIATGNTFQTILTASVKRQSLTIENNNASDSCWITFGTGITAGNATKAKSILLTSGGSFTRYWPYVPSDEIEATCASNSDTLYVDNQ